MSNNKINTIHEANTTGGVKLDLPSEIRRIVVVPADVSKYLSIKFADADDYLVLPAGIGYDSGISNAKIASSNITVKMSDNSGVYVEYWT